MDKVRKRKALLVGVAIALLASCSHSQTLMPEVIPTNSATPLPPPQAVDLGTFGMGAAWNMEWSADGNMLAVESSTGGYVYDASNWNLIASIPTEALEDGRLRRLTFFPDNQRLLFISGYPTIFWQYDLRAQKVSRVYESITDEPYNAPLFSPDGKLFTFKGSICTQTEKDNTCRQTLNLYDAITGELIRKIPENGLGRWEDITVYAFSPDSRWVATGGEDDVVRVWEVASGTLKYKLQHESDVRSLSFSLDGGVLVSAGMDAAVRFWDMKSGKSLYTLRGTLDEFYQAAAYMDGGRKLLINYYDGKFKEYSLDERFLPVSPLGVKIETEKRLMKQMGRYIPELVIRVNSNGNQMALLVNGNVQIWDLQNGKKIYVLPEFIREVYAIGFSPDEKILAVADHNVHLWQIQPKRFIGTLEVKGRQVMDIAFHPNGKQAAFALTGGDTAEIWDLTLQRRIRTLVFDCPGEFHFYSLNAQIAYSPDGSQLAFAGACAIQLADANTGKILKKFPNNLGTPAGISFSADGNVLIYASDYGRSAWNLKTGRRLYSIKRMDDYQASVALSPKLLVTAKWESPLYFFDSISGKRLYEFPPGDGSNALALSRDGRLLALDNYNKISLLDSSSGAELLSLNFYLPYTLTFSPNGKFLAARSYQENVHLWDISSATQYAEYSPLQTATPNAALTPTLQPTSTPAPTLAFSFPTAPVSPPTSSQAERIAKMQKLGELGLGRMYTMAWSPDGTLLAVGGYPGAYIFEAGKSQPSQFFPAKNVLLALKFSPNGQYLAGQVSNEAIQLWDLTTGESLQTLENIGCWNRGMEFSEDSESLTVDCGDAKYTWDVASGKLINKETPTLKNGPISGHYTLQVGMRNARLIDAENGEIVKTFEIPGMAPSVAKFSPDGKTLVVWHYQYEIARTGVYYPGQDLKTVLQLWNIFPDQPPTLRFELATGAWCQGFLIGDEFQGLAFSSDSRILATASGDGTTQIWDVFSGRLLHTLPNGNKIYFSPDNKYLATLDDDNARVWNISSGNPRSVWEISGFNRSLYAIAFAENGQELVSVMDEYLRFFALTDPNMTAPIRQIKLPGLRGFNLAISPDGNRLAYNDAEGIWIGENEADGPNWQALVKFPEPHKYARNLVLTFSSDGSLLASYGLDDKKWVWDLKTMNALELESPVSTSYIYISQFLFSPDGTLLLGADSKTSDPSSMYLWDLHTGKLVRQWTAQVYQFVFHPTQPLFVGVDYMSGVIRFFDLRSGDLIKEIRAVPHIQCLAFSPDGKLLALGYENRENGEGKIEIRDAETLTLLKEIPGDSRVLTFSPDGTILAIGMSDGRIEYWGWREK